MKKQRTLSILFLLFLSLQPQLQVNAAQPSTMNQIDSDGLPRNLPVQGRNCGQEGGKAKTWGISLVCKNFDGKKIWARADGKNTAYSPIGYSCPANNQWLRIDQYKYPCVKKNGKLVWGKGTYLDAGIAYKQIPGAPKQPAIYSITQQQQTEKDPRTGKMIPEQIITYVDALNSIEKEIEKICSTTEEASNYCGIGAAKTKQIDFNQSKNYLVSNGFNIFYWPTSLNDGSIEKGIWIRSDGEDKTGSPAGAPCAYEEMNGDSDAKVKSIQEMPYVRFEEKIYTCITSGKGRVFDQGVPLSEYVVGSNLANFENGNWVKFYKNFTSSIEKSGYNSSINGIAGTLCRPWWGEKELSIFGVPMTCVVFDPKAIPQRSQITELWDLNSDAIYCVIDKSLIKASNSASSSLREIVLVTESCQRMIVEKRLV
jgi:hypothetical protein